MWYMFECNFYFSQYCQFWAHQQPHFHTCLINMQQMRRAFTTPSLQTNSPVFSFRLEKYFFLFLRKWVHTNICKYIHMAFLRSQSHQHFFGLHDSEYWHCIVITAFAALLLSSRPRTLPLFALRFALCLFRIICHVVIVSTRIGISYLRS